VGLRRFDPAGDFPLLWFLAGVRRNEGRKKLGGGGDFSLATDALWGAGFVVLSGPKKTWDKKFGGRGGGTDDAQGIGADEDPPPSRHADLDLSFRQAKPTPADFSRVQFARDGI